MSTDQPEAQAEKIPSRAIEIDPKDLPETVREQVAVAMSADMVRETLNNLFALRRSMLPFLPPGEMRDTFYEYCRAVMAATIDPIMADYPQEGGLTDEQNARLVEDLLAVLPEAMEKVLEFVRLYAMRYMEPPPLRDFFAYLDLPPRLPSPPPPVQTADAAITQDDLHAFNKLSLTMDGSFLGELVLVKGPVIVGQDGDIPVTMLARTTEFCEHHPDTPLESEVVALLVTRPVMKALYGNQVATTRLQTLPTRLDADRYPVVYLPEPASVATEDAPLPADDGAR